MIKSTPSLALLVVSASCFLLPFANAVDWPQWRGINRDGISSEKISPASWGKDGPKQLWKKRSAPEYRPWQLSAGRLYTMGNNGSVDVVFLPRCRHGRGNLETHLSAGARSPFNLRAVQPAHRRLTATRSTR